MLSGGLVECVAEVMRLRVLGGDILAVPGLVVTVTKLLEQGLAIDLLASCGCEAELFSVSFLIF